VKIALADAVNLLHSVSYGVLATHAAQTPGYPYATVLPFVPDERHRPVVLISALAEHTKNLIADPRASLVVYVHQQQNVLAGARMTLIGDAARFDAGEQFIARYLRYQPDAKDYLALADFAFFRFTPRRLRAIAGFGAMGWIEAESFEQAAWIEPGQEAEMIASADISGPTNLLGVDPYGVDVARGDRRERHAFPNQPVALQDLPGSLAQVLSP
jgi:putative heme iron utilization protein